MMLKKINSALNNKSGRRIIAIIIILLIIVVTLIILRIQAEHSLRKRTNAAAVHIVEIMVARPEKSVETIILPGNVDAWHETTIYARTNGYIKKWYVDIGSHVKTGELLAEIETPELDAQLRQAQADLKTAIANNNLAQTTATRWLGLLKTDSVSKQETDEKVSSAKALEAVVTATQANVNRLQELVGFERVIAPFDGVITSRTTDIGSLINAGSSSTARPLFRLSQTNPLRIYVRVPQTYSSRITPKMKVRLYFAEHPGQSFPATLLQTAQAIDPITRTLLAQFVAENKAGILLPGGYTEVKFTMPILPNTFRIPVNTLLFRAQGLQIATLDNNNKVILKSISISRDFGAEVEINTGIAPGERIVINPPDAIINGEQVRVAS